MNSKRALTRLFSPAALASTLTAGMLLHSIAVAIAGQLCDSTDAYMNQGELGCTSPCTGYVEHGCVNGTYYWCCPTGTTCALPDYCYAGGTGCVCWCECN